MIKYIIQIIISSGFSGCNPQKVWVAILYKAQEWHASTYTTSEAIGHLVHELSKLILRAHI